MIDQATQLAIQQEVKNQLLQRDNLNAKGTLFNANTGMHTQGQNLVGLTGDRAIHNVIRFNATTQTIASGVIQFSSGYIKIDTEAAAATDDLDTIAPMTLAQDNEIVILTCLDTTHTVVVKTGTGNMTLAGDFTMLSNNDSMILRWDKSRTRWIEVNRTTF